MRAPVCSMGPGCQGQGGHTQLARKAKATIPTPARPAASELVHSRLGWLRLWRQQGARRRAGAARAGGVRSTLLNSLQARARDSHHCLGAQKTAPAPALSLERGQQVLATSRCQVQRHACACPPRKQAGLLLGTPLQQVT